MSAAVASASAAAALTHYTTRSSTSVAIPANHHHNHNNNNSFVGPPNLGRYESLKRSDWNTFRQYLRIHDPPLPVTCFGVAHVLGFLNYLAQAKTHADTCPFLGLPHAPGPCACPSRSLDAVVGRLRASFDEHAGSHVTNPFGARAVMLYLRDAQARDRGRVYDRTETSNKDINCNGKAEQPQVYFVRSVKNGNRGRGVGAMFFAAAGCFRS